MSQQPLIELLPLQVRKYHLDDLEAVGEQVQGCYLEKDTFLIDTLDGLVVASPWNRQPDGTYYDTLRDKYYNADGSVVVAAAVGSQSEIVSPTVSELAGLGDQAEPKAASMPTSPVSSMSAPNTQMVLPARKASTLATALSKELNGRYVERRFPRGSAGAFDGKDGMIYFIIYAFIEDPKNNQFGRWIASWEYDSRKGDLNGQVFVEYVCREDVNLHFNQTLKYDNKCDCVNDEHQVVEFVLRNVAIAGDTVQSALIEQQEQFYGDHFKRVRRQLPITRAKMDWY